VAFSTTRQASPQQLSLVFYWSGLPPVSPNDCPVNFGFNVIDIIDIDIDIDIDVLIAKSH